MILVTTGTNGPPFDRLLTQLAGLGRDEELVVQHGPSAVRTPGATSIEYMSFSKLVELIRDARLVVTHAGVGSILVSLMNGKRPLVVPRLERFREAVDDHQLELGRRLDQQGLVVLVEDPADLPRIVRSTCADVDSWAPGNQPLVADLRDYLMSAARGDR